MTLRQLMAEADVVSVHGAADPPVTGLAYDSRRVAPGDVFFALAGVRADGARFLDAAFAAGAVAAVAGRGAAAREPWVEVEEPRRALAEAACVWHQHPSRALTMAGVTGTNGKTTITWLLESVFRAAGWTSGVIGTTGIRIGEAARPSAFTTPEAVELQATLREMREAGVRAVAMEVSSHALAQRRAFGVAFDVVVFTNLSQDHLDYHGTMESYLDAKLMLFDGRNGGGGKPATAVVATDDSRADRVLDAARRGGLEAFTVGARPAAGGPDLRVSGVAARHDGLDVTLELAVPAPLARRFPSLAGAGGTRTLALPLLGRHNAMNAAEAYAAALALGVGEGAIRRGLETVRGVPGRLERVEAGQAFQVVVDYAHTPDALERALDAAREHAAGRVLLVFGCGGDRDRAKRPLMGRIAAERADRAWVTNDNPRGEDPRAIAAEILAGASAGTLAVTLDRRAAIAAALAEARPGDLVLVAGKGHETTQTIGGEVLPFDDRAVARELLGGGRG